MPVDEEIITKFHELKSTVNIIRNFDAILPEDLSNIEMLIHWIAYFINPTYSDLDGLTGTYGIKLSPEERDTIYPLIISFILFVKDKYI